MSRCKPLALLLALALATPTAAPAQGRVISRTDLQSLFQDSLSANKLRIVAGNRTDTVPAAAQTWRLRPGQIITAAAGNAVTKATPFPSALRTNVLALPFRYLTTNATGSATLYLRPTVEVSGGGLRYEGAERGWRGSFLLGLEDSLHADQSHTLASGIRFAITAEADSLTPRMLTVGHTNLPFQEVLVVTHGPPSTDSLRVHIRPQFNPEGVDLWLAVQRPGLTLRPSPARIQGFGLETTTLSVGRSGGAPGEQRVVALTADRGNPEPNELTLDATGTGFAKIRSSGMGRAVVRAESPPFAPAETEVEFLFPLAFLIAALLGGSTGGVARALQSRRTRKRRSLAKSALTGIVVGLLIAVLYAIGINVLGIDLRATYGEALVFAIAALGAIAGKGAITRVLRPATGAQS